MDCDAAVKSLGDEAFFLDSLPELKAGLTGAPLSGGLECAQLKAQAHSIKGLALTFGCVSLQEAAYALEKMALATVNLVAKTEAEARAVIQTCDSILEAQSAPLLPQLSPTPSSVDGVPMSEVRRVSVVKLAEVHPATDRLDSSLEYVTLDPLISPRVTFDEANKPVLTADVLVVDDQFTMRKIVAKTLERAGLSVISVESAAASLAFVKGGGRVHVVLMDKEMPEMGGVEATRALCILPFAANDKRPTILGFTASADAAALAAFTEAGAKGVISKPLTADKIKTVRGYFNIPLCVHPPNATPITP